VDWKPDVLSVFGRGIEKVDGIWQPTAYIERLSEKGGHPGMRAEGITPFDNDPRIVIAGGEVNALACAMLYKEFATQRSVPKVVVFAAGRPAYLADDPDPDLTEGRVMHRWFLGSVIPQPGTQIVFQANNRNTRDDFVETLEFAKSRGLSRIAIITVQVHIPRCQEFLKHVPEEMKHGIDILWFASEPIVLRHFPEAYPELWEAMISPAYARTAERERKGIEDLRAGHYNFGAQGYSFAQK